MLTPERMALLKRAAEAEAAGLCVIPVRADGSKRPLPATWERFQTTRTTRDEIASWFTQKRPFGIGLVCGAVSGHLVLFEFDDFAVFKRFLAAAEEAGLGALVARIRDGYEEETPGGGIHWFCFVAAGRAKTEALARRMGVDRHGRPCALPLIEVKGEGGFAIIAPSGGGVHPAGKPYLLRSGGVGSIPTITEAERDALWSLARSFNELEPQASRDEQPRVDGKWLVRPGDDFNARAEWCDILEPHGWEAVKEQGEATLWRRPGGYEGGWGASTNHGGHDLLHVWTTAAPPFQPDKSYAKFTAYALLNHQGDFRAAATALESEGYGQRRPKDESGSAEASGESIRVLVPVMPFPVEALPEPARGFVAAGAKALGCPPDFVALPLLAFIGAVAGNSRKLRLKAGYEVEPIFWIGVVGKPGTAKSPALSLSRRLVDVLQKASWTVFQEQSAAWLAEKPKERGPQPRLESYFASDTTIEAVASALQVSRGIAIIHDELVGWVLAFDAYRKAGDRQAWLSSWSAAPLKPNRKTGDPIYVPEPVVCVTGGIQPAVLADLAGEAAKDDGFVPRLLIGWPDAEPSPWSDDVLPEPTFTALLTVVRALRLPFGTSVVTPLAREAYREWIAWYDENRAITGAATGLAAGWAAKAPVHLARIALALHLLAYPDDHARPLVAATLRDAILILEYFRDHLRRVLPMFGSVPPTGGVGLPSRLLRLLNEAQPEWIARSVLGERLGGHHPSSAVGEALARLEQEGRIERRSVETGGRHREEWRALPQSSDVAAREKMGNDRKSLADEAPPPLFPSFPVFSHDEVDEPAAPWETWEEGL